MSKRDPHTTRLLPALRRLAAAFLLLAAVAPAAGQSEPCGFYEWDGVPGYGAVDLFYVADFWRETGSFPDIPDADGNGRVDVRDMVAQTNCVPELARGLAGSYYGFNTGESGQVFTFPDFSAIPFPPAVVKAADRLEVYDGRNGFLNSDMRNYFGAVYEGYLMVPETAVYTLEISGREGMRVTLDGNERLFFDGSPRNDSVSLPLSYGLHPIRIELYVRTNGAAVFSWSSNGTVIGSVPQIVGPDYLYHAPAPTLPDTVTNLDVVFDPPSASRATAHRTHVQAWIRGADSDITFHFNGKDRILYDGKMDEEVPLTAGLNPIPYTITDSRGNSTSGVYHLYWDAVPAMQPGLNVNLYAEEWYQGRVPDTTGKVPYRWLLSPITQLEADPNGRVYLNDRYIPGYTVVEMKGAIRILTAGVHEFRIADGSGALYINGQQLLGRNHDYPGQFNTSTSIYLDQGRHHYMLRVGRNGDSSPRMRVYWTRPGGSEILINDTYFLHDPAEKLLPPDFSDAQSTGGRERVDQVAEYVFAPGAPFADTAGKGYDLPVDRRATPRATGGVTYAGPGGLSSQEAGVQLIERIKETGNFTLEVDFVYNDELSNTERHLMSLRNGDTRLIALYTRNDDIFYRIRDQNGDTVTVEGSNLLTPGNRYHVAANFNGGAMHLYVNGVQVGNASFFAETDRWPALASLDVGQGVNRRHAPGNGGNQMFGSFLVAAAYNRRLGPTSMVQNMNANLTVTPTPGSTVYAIGATFPPPGTSQAAFDEAAHVLNRLAFGPSPESLNQVLGMGVNAWIAQQLDPMSIDDTAVEQELARHFIPDRYIRDLQGWTIYRMAHSKRRLLEVMTWFWENHFNTEFNKTNDLEEELAENMRFRDLALGDFARLLEASAMNYPMTVYLDSDSNVVGAPNENYAREILELHTFGVNNGYTQQDIEEAARCFTGWTIRNGRFYFNPGLHDYGPKSLLGLTIPAGGGMSDGLAVINHVAHHANTAAFISWKLCQYFVADDPPASLVSDIATVFQTSGGDIRQVLEALFAHPSFRTDPDMRGNKLKTPLEFALSMFRAAEMASVLDSLTWHLEEMGMELYNYADPTGFPEESVAWLDTNSLSQRWNMINQFTTNRRHSVTPSINFQAMTARFNWHTYDDVLDTFEHLTTHGYEPAGVRALTQQWLTDGDPGGFTLDPTTLDTAVRQTLGLYFRLSEFNQQ